MTKKTTVNSRRRFRIRKLKYYLNSEMQTVPRENMTEINMLKEYVAVTLGVEAQDLHNRLVKFRQKTINMLQWYKERKARILKINKMKRKRASTNTKKKEKKGYGQVTAFSGTYRVEVKNPPYIKVGDGFQNAKELMGEVIHDELSDNKEFLTQMFDDAFSINKEGLVKVSAIMKLMEYQVDDPRWQKGKEILIADMQTLRRRLFPAYYMRDEEGKFIPITLEFSRV